MSNKLISELGVNIRVLVCGGRSFDDLPLLDQTLDRLHKDHEFAALIHGGARGADEMAHFWAGSNRVPIEVYHADWKRYGNQAGPIRNQRMIDEGKPHLVIAFPGGRGTQDMKRRAMRAGLGLINVQKDSISYARMTD